MSGTLNLLVMDVGNTRTQLGRVLNASIDETAAFGNEDTGGIVERTVEWWTSLPDDTPKAVLIASVNDPVADRLASMLHDQLSEEIYRLGDDIPIPIAEELDPETLTGVDRLLNAVAAYDTAKQACVVVDAGSAVTVDFVDGEGTFHGGAIAPGARMQLKALSQYTNSLPDIDFVKPLDGQYGKSTGQAMLQGVYYGIRGMVWRLVEQYAQSYGAYPMVIVTGGDAQVLFGEDDLIDRLVPHLTLLGIAASARHVLDGHPRPAGEPTD
jgi:type III pantothenate kinase